MSNRTVVIPYLLVNQRDYDQELQVNVTQLYTSVYSSLAWLTCPRHYMQSTLGTRLTAVETTLYSIYS